MGEVRWIDDGFRGLLPMPFNSTLGGTSAAPSYFNDKNKASEEQYVINPSSKLVHISQSVSPFSSLSSRLNLVAHYKCSQINFTAS